MGSFAKDQIIGPKFEFFGELTGVKRAN